MDEAACSPVKHQLLAVYDKLHSFDQHHGEDLSDLAPCVVFVVAASKALNEFSLRVGGDEANAVGRHYFIFLTAAVIWRGLLLVPAFLFGPVGLAL